MCIATILILPENKWKQQIILVERSYEIDKNRFANRTIIEVSRSPFQSVLYLFDRCQISPKPFICLKDKCEYADR